MYTIPEKIYKSGLKFLAPLNLQKTYRCIVEEGINLVKANYGSILLLQQRELSRVYASAPILYKIKPRKRDFMYRVLQTKKTVVLDVKRIAKSHPEIKKTHIRSDIILPLLNHNEVIGVLSIMSVKEKYFTEREISILKLFVPLAVMAIRKAQLHDETYKALEARDLFMSMAAHELRTPLTTVNGYAQLLYSKLAKANTPESRWAEELTAESYRLTQLVNELLEVDRIKTGHFRYDWKECSLKEIINRALMDFRFTHPDNKVIFKNRLATNQDRIIGDYNKLLQVTINLLDNAAKFSPPEEEIIISLKSRYGYIILEIKDKGKGISKKELPKVYEMFFRGKNHTREGIGVGLFLAKNIITQHHGTINIHSRENKGTKVELKLPKHRIQ